MKIDQQKDGPGPAPSIPFAEVRAWLFETALPFWASTGVEPGLGFVERMTLAGVPEPVGFKRMRVQARQIYVFSHAALIGFDGGAAAAAEGYGFITAHGRRGAGGFARLLGRTGGVLDPAMDLYDQAFVLLALAYYHRATGDPEAIRLAGTAWGDIVATLGRGDGRGFRAAEDAGREGSQNPHMHLLEAVLALYEATGVEFWAVQALRLGDLFASTLYDQRTGTLAERFDVDWRRETPAAIEPGHHFEWVWLLDRLQQFTGRALSEPAERLFAFAEAYGVEAGSGLVHDVVSDTGVLVKGSHRLWGQAERLKALLVQAERNGAADHAAIAATARNLLDHYLAPAPFACWRDQLDANLAWTDDKVPASSLYHLFLAFAELLRMQPRLEASA